MEENSEHFERIVSVIVPIIFGIIMCIGAIGNFLVILVILCTPQMYLTTNVLILNLAIADILFIIFCIPFTATDFMFDIWPFGLMWCKIDQYLIVVTVLASIYTIVLMSLERYFAVIHPIKSRSSVVKRNFRRAIVLLWIIALFVSIPVLFAHGLVVDTESKTVSCHFLIDELIPKVSYQFIFMILTYILPLSLITFLYIRIVVRLKRISIKEMTNNFQYRKRTTNLVMAIVLVFALLWLPIQLLLFLKTLKLYEVDSLSKVLIQICAHALAYMASCLNPFLYTFFSEKFRKTFSQANFNIRCILGSFCFRGTPEME